jgi:hypothetical protein
VQVQFLHNKGFSSASLELATASLELATASLELATVSLVTFISHQCKSIASSKRISDLHFTHLVDILYKISKSIFK